MLQQTQVATVIDYFNNFTAHFPTLLALAEASEEQVLAQWAGLGYYARARNLHKSAKIIIKEHQGVFPQSLEQVLALPGIGESTAGAILSLSFEQNHAILDGNVKRVLARYHQVSGHYQQSQTLKTLWQLARWHTPDKQSAHYTQAIMDLGATICTRSKPKCEHCPVQNGCLSYQDQTQDQYPNPKPKKRKPTRDIAVLIFSKHQQVLLQKRPDSGIWGGLWSLPECDNTPQAIAKAVTAFDPLAKVIKTLAVLSHSFTHYHLNIHPILISAKKTDAHYYVPEQQVLGVPAPIKKILQQAAQELSLAHLGREAPALSVK